MTKKERAVSMRRAKKSYREISAALGIPKGTLSGWFNGEAWSAAIARELDAATRPMHRARIAAMARARSVKFAALRAEARREARVRFPKLFRSPLFVAGLALFWGEGERNVERGRVRVPNVDPDLLVAFTRFLVECAGVPRERIRPWILLYPDLDAVRCLRYWSKVLDVPSQQFQRAQVIAGRSTRRRLPYGVCTVYVSDRLLRERIDEWMHCLREALHLPHVLHTVESRAGIA